MRELGREIQFGVEPANCHEMYHGDPDEAYDSSDDQGPTWINPNIPQDQLPSWMRRANDRP